MRFLNALAYLVLLWVAISVAIITLDLVVNRWRPPGSMLSFIAWERNRAGSIKVLQRCVAAAAVAVLWLVYGATR